MSGVLSFLLRNGASLLRESAELFIGQALVRSATRRLKGILIFYAALSILALAALAFFYVLLYLWLASMLGDIAGAAIMFGANLFLIAAMLIGRTLMQSKAPAMPASPILQMIKAQSGALKSRAGKSALVKPARAGSLATGGGPFAAGMEIGSRIGGHLRKAAPRVALGAVVLGLVIGLRPQLLGFLRRGKRPTVG
jgi:hypothetical protein